MKTRIYPPAGVHGFGRYRTVGVVTCPLDPIDGFRAVEYLAAHGIPLRVVQDRRTVQLYPLAPTTTEQEGAALRAFQAITDEPVIWRGPRRPIAAACLLCDATGVDLEHDLCARCAVVFQPVSPEAVKL